jgi:hypothetical protein
VLEPTKEQRCDRAYRVALIYAHDQNHEDIESAIIDLTTDLLHLADQYGLEQDYLQRVSLEHYRAEQDLRPASLREDALPMPPYDIHERAE